MHNQLTSLHAPAHTHFVPSVSTRTAKHISSLFALARAFIATYNTTAFNDARF